MKNKIFVFLVVCLLMVGCSKKEFEIKPVEEKKEVIVRDIFFLPSNSQNLDKTDLKTLGNEDSIWISYQHGDNFNVVDIEENKLTKIKDFVNLIYTSESYQQKLNIDNISQQFSNQKELNILFYRDLRIGNYYQFDHPNRITVRSIDQLRQTNTNIIIGVGKQSQPIREVDGKIISYSLGEFQEKQASYLIHVQLVIQDDKINQYYRIVPLYVADNKIYRLDRIKKDISLQLEDILKYNQKAMYYKLEEYKNYNFSDY